MQTQRQCMCVCIYIKRSFQFHVFRSMPFQENIELKIQALTHHNLFDVIREKMLLFSFYRSHVMVSCRAHDKLHIKYKIYEIFGEISSKMIIGADFQFVNWTHPFGVNFYGCLRICLTFASSTGRHYEYLVLYDCMCVCSMNSICIFAFT